MFNSQVKELEKKLESATRHNSELVSALEEMARSHRTDFVLKLIPEVDDQFYIDGEFVADESRAIYGSHQLTFSEAVCWKAGKEVARRNYEAIISDSKQDADVSSKISQRAADELEKSNQYLSVMQTELADSNSQLAKAKEQIEIADRSLEVMRNEVQRLTGELEAVSSSSDTWRGKYENVKSELDKLCSYKPDDTIHTRYGVCER